jgi:hypothetical protein
VGPVASGALYASLGPSAPFNVAALAALCVALLGARLRRVGLGQERKAARQPSP